MAVWRVRQHPDQRWQVLTPFGTQACARVEAQHEAIAAALQLASEEGGGHVLVEDSCGHEDHRRTAEAAPLAVPEPAPQPGETERSRRDTRH